MADGLGGSVDVVRALAKLQDAEKQGRFALARALTMTAKDAAAEDTAALPQIFDRPTPFTKRSVGITPATVKTLQAVVFIKDVQAGYLALEEVGGVRTPRPGAPVVLPVNIRKNLYGNIARGAIGRARAKPDVFVSKQDSPRTRHLPPGFYQRAQRGERRGGGGIGTTGALRLGPGGKKSGGVKGKGRLTSLKLLAALEPKAAYHPRFGMKRRVIATAHRVFPMRFIESARLALETARS